MALSNLKKLLIRNFRQLISRKIHTEVASVKHEVHGARTKTEKAPFMKNVCLGIVDEDILSFPEIEVSEDSDPDKLLQLQSKAIVAEETPFLRLLRSGICSLGVPQAYGGIPSYSTHFVMNAEKLDIDPLTSSLLETQYSLVIESLLKYGSELQKNLYVKDLTSGIITGAYALHEEEAGSDPPSLQCSATQKDQSEDISYILNGEKTWIINASTAQFFIVLAQFRDTNRPSVGGLLSAFIVEKETPGVTIKSLDNISECDICNLKFDNVVLPSHSLLGNIGEGYNIAVTNLESCKFIFTASILRLIRKLLSLITVQVSQTSRFPVPLREYELVQYRLSKVTATLFALESSVYLLAGMKDIYSMDTSFESVIVQNLIHTYGMNALQEYMNIAGTRALDGSHPYPPITKNLQLLFRTFTTPDILKLYISLKALEYSAKSLSSTLQKVRNPLNFPGFMFKRILNSRRQTSDSPKLDKGLYMHFHPSLKTNADQLEYSVCRLQFSLECLLTQHGTQSVQRQVDLVRLSDVISDIFTMVAVLARASRSYCTGIRYADQEILVANAWCSDVLKRIKMNVSEIVEGQVSFRDYSLLKLAPDILQNKGYFFVSPVEKNIH